MNDKDNSSTYDVTYGNIYLANPSKTGHTFLYWYTDPARPDNSKIGAGSPAIPAGSTGNITFYAMWRANTYTVRFHHNYPGQASGSMPDQTFTWGQEQALRSNAFQRNGYNFAGWATSASGNKVYNDGQKVKNLTETDGDIVNLYAVWNLITYTITYHLNGCNNDHGNPATYTVLTQGITLKDPTRDGDYVFDGWHDNPNFSGSKITYIAPGTTGNLNLYASWKNYGRFNVEYVSGSTFKITRTGGYDSTQTVHYRTQNGSAIGGTHFTHVDSFVTFNQGEKEKTVTISEKSVTTAYKDSSGKEWVATSYSNEDRVYFLDIYKVVGVGKLGEKTRAERKMTKNSSYTVASEQLNSWVLLASVD